MIFKEILSRHTAEKFLSAITRTIQTTVASVCLKNLGKKNVAVIHFMDYVIIFPRIPSKFEENAIDVLPDRQIMLKIYISRD